MRVLWILCLLIGSISCVPVGKKHGSSTAGTGFRRQPSYGYRFSGGGLSSDPRSSSSSLPSLPNLSSGKSPMLPAPQDALSSAGPGSYNSLNMAGGNEYGGGYANFRAGRYNSPEISTLGAAYAASRSSGYASGAPGGGYGGYASSGSGYVGDASYGFVVAPRDEDGSSGSATGYGADETPEPVFSDVSDLEPVYYSSSRSRYQQGRALFTQTRYTPGEPFPPVMPVSRPISETPNQMSPAKAPTKGGF